MEVRDPYGYGLDYTNQSYYIDNPDTSVGGKVRVTDVNGTPFDYLGASRKVDLFYYDDTDASFAPDIDDQVFAFEFEDASFGVLMM